MLAESIGIILTPVQVVKTFGASRHHPPFGMLIPGRSFSSEKYRFGFNGKEKDDEVKGIGNSYDFDARIYDARLGVWLSIDPLWGKFPGESTYSSFGNNPIYFVDNNGKTKTTYITTIENGISTTISVVNKDYVLPRTVYAKVPDVPNEGMKSIPYTLDFNVVEFITIDVDNNTAYTTGEITTDPAWNDGFEAAWNAASQMFAPSKQSNQAGGNSLVGNINLPNNHSKYAPTAQSPGKPIDITDLLGGRGGAELSGGAGKIASIVEVLRNGFEVGLGLGDIIDQAVGKDRFCTDCLRTIDRNTNKPIKDDKTSPKDTSSFEDQPHDDN